MDIDKSLDKYKLIATLLSDVFETHGSAYNTKQRRLTLSKVKRRLDSEGVGFLTKTLPKLGKALDKALAEDTPMNSIDHGFKPMTGSKLPKFMGELFKRVLDDEGKPLANPCVLCIKSIRQITYCLYKYELPYTDEQESKVLAKFTKTEQELEHLVYERLCQLGIAVTDDITWRYNWRPKGPAKDPKAPSYLVEVTREARRLLAELFSFFDPKDILPRHGPGAVATRQQLWSKYQWRNVSAKITRSYPLDAYFYASLGHVCDRLDSLKEIETQDLPARVILVPKDSRGPRLISCEPVDYQWVQQGLGRAIVGLVERHPLTRYSVYFTDQVPNRVGALLGSQEGKYATLDLNEASDRVSTELVRLLFPEHLYKCLMDCRSSSTTLPDGMILPLHKFAPMGSALCFPIMALSVWAILAAGLTKDTVTNSSGHVRYVPSEFIHVYGDDVIVPTAEAEDAIELLESFGLKVNRDKSCTKGFFRESCGMDAYRGVDVTPVRLRTVWSSSPSPDSYASWIAYANSFWSRKYYATYDYIVGLLHRVYGAIPAKDMCLTCPSLAYVPDTKRPRKHRTNHDLQKVEWRVRDVVTRPITKEIDGWSMLLRSFAEHSSSASLPGTTGSWDPLTWAPSESSVSSVGDECYTLAPRKGA